MNNNNLPGNKNKQQSSANDDTVVKNTSENSHTPQQGKVNNIDNNTKLENEPDSGDLNDDD